MNLKISWVYLVVMFGSWGCCGLCGATLLDEDEKHALLYLHNNARKFLNIFVYDNQALPIPTKMRELTWDDNLEVITQQTANLCVYEHGDPDTDEYTAWYNRYGQPGQNLAGGTNVVSSFLNWYYYEAEDYDPTTDACVDEATCSHLTQVLSDLSTVMACARPDEAVCDKQYLFCDFYPSGNVEGYVTYETGDTACSAMETAYFLDENQCRACVDDDPSSCARQKSENGGVCSDDFADTCLFTCDKCDNGTVQLLPGSCADTGADCAAYDEAGYCDPSSDYYYLALDECRNTCGMTCECMDSLTRCSRLDTYCDSDTYHLYMTTNCPLTCGLCDVSLNLTYSV